MSRENLDDLRTPDVRSNNTESYPASPRSPIIADLYSPTARALILHPNASDVGCCNRAAAALLHTMDFVKISLVTQTLLSRWLHQLFLELERYDRAPSMEIQKTWLGYPIMGMAASLSVMAKVLNAMYSTEKYLAAEDYVAALFRSAQFYFFWDLWAGAQSMPLGAFITVSVIFLLPLAFFFTKHALPDSDNKIYFRQADFDFISRLRISTGSNTERPFNCWEGLLYGTTALSTLLWTINREIQGKTVALPVWQWGLMSAGMLCSAKVGYDLTDHPKRFQLLAMGSKFLKEGALAYAAASGIFYMGCHGESSCADVGVRIALIIACSLVALSIAFYAAVTTRFRFEENCERIEKFVDNIRNAPETMANGLAAIGNYTVGFFTSCCKREEPERLGLAHSVV